MFDTVIFDCDGTLSDSEYLNNKATADVLAELGFPRYTVEVSMDKFVGMAMTEVKKFIETEEGRAVPDSFIPDFIDRVAQYQKTGLKPVAGAVEAVTELVPKYKTCVASNGERSNVISSLEMIGLYDFFGDEKTFTKIQVARGKPAPDLFLFAAERLSSDPASCIVIEDSASGVMAGVAAGMYVIGFTGSSHDHNGTAANLKAAGAHTICASWPDILHSINSLTAEEGPVRQSYLPLANR